MLKHNVRLLLFVSLAISASSPANNPFVGDWKLNPSKSRLTDRMTVENVGGNRYIFNLGGGSETIATDGSDQPGQGGTTLSVTIEGPDAWKVTRKRDGHMLLTADWTLSKDGTSLTDDFTSFSQDGSPSNIKYVYKRMAGGTGFAGTWESTSEMVNFVYVLQIRPYEDDGLSIIDSSSQLTRNMKLDGKDYPNVGASAAFVAASSVRRVDERTLEVTDKKSDGTLFDVLQLRLSSDRKAMTLTPRSKAGDRPNILVFERQ